MTEKRSSRTILLLITVLILLNGWACTKTEPPGVNAQTSSLANILAQGTNTTIFNSAIIKAGLDSTFSGPSRFTLMVPTDQACNNSGFSQAVINGFSHDQARQWVLYQTYAGNVLPFESFIGKTELKLVMANGDSVFVTGDSNRTFVNGYQFINSELRASNGIMLALQNVLVPPAKNLAQLVASDTGLSFFNTAIQLARPVPDTLSLLFENGGPFTLIAPVNDAFRLHGYQSPADLNKVSSDSLRALVLLSLIPRRFFSYDVVDSNTFKTVSDSTLLFNIKGLLPTLQVLGNTKTSNVISVNSMAINGVLFKMDELLEPYTH